MPTAGKLWQTALSKLRQLPAEPHQLGSVADCSSFFATSLAELLPTLAEFLDTDRVSSSEWKQLVVELKVPLHLGRVVASTTDLSAPRGYAAICALDALLSKAVEDGVLASRGSAGSCHSLGRSLGKQLQQSGLVAALPAQLNAAAVALKAAQNAPAPARVLQHSMSVKSAADAVCAVVATAFLRIQFAAAQLLHLCTTLVTSPQQVDRSTVSLPALCACAAALQHCSRFADLASADDPAPVAIGALANSAATAVEAVCSVWMEQNQVLHCGAFAASVGSPESLQAISMLLLACTLFSPSIVDETPDIASSSRASSSGSRASSSSSSSRARTSSNRASTTTQRDIPAHASTVGPLRRQAAWQFACSHESDCSVLQQQALQELGCSSRALMYAAQQGLPAKLDSPELYGVVQLAGHGFLGLAQHQPSVPELDQPEQLQQLAEALAQLKEGSSPPCSGYLLPCATLLWLVPAVLLEWLQKQPADGPHAHWYSQMFSAQLYVGLEQIKEQWQFWEHAARMCVAAAKQQEQQGTAASSMSAAGRVAEEFVGSFRPLPSNLVQLLQLLSSAGARIMPCLQEARRTVTPEGGGSSSSSMLRHRFRIGSGSISSMDRGRRNGEDVQHTPYASLSEKQLESTLWHMSQALCLLLCMISRTLNIHANVDTAASHSTPGGMDEQGSRPTSQDSKQDSLASLCSALQQTLPQLISLSEAALRAGDQSDQYELLLHGAVLMQEVSSQGLFVAVGLQPGSPAVKRLSGLVFTMLKQASVASAMLAKPQPEVETAMAAASCLCSALCVNSLVLQAACVSSSNGDCSKPEALINMLLQTALFTGNGEASDTVHREHQRRRLSIISDSTASTGTSNSSDSDVFVPWLVSLGRCCMVHSQLMQQSQPGADPVWAPATQSRQETMELMAQALQEVAAVLPAWLQSGSVSAQLAAAGYSTQPVMELLQSIVQAGQGAAQAEQAATAAAAVPPELMQELGLALCNLPVGTACNNHRCSSLAGLSEQQLVVGTARLCAGCRVARYCCRACQVAAWKQHKPACKAVASARAAKADEQSHEQL